VTELLDAKFAERPRQEWLDILHAAGVPRGPVTTRDEWFYGDQVTDNEMRVTLDHPKHGAVDMPGVPVKLRSTPGAVRGFLQEVNVDEVLHSWDVRTPGDVAVAGGSGSGPLAGVTVLDLGVIIAAPHASTVLANMGANVIKVEPIDGDSFRPFGLGFVGYNQGKRSISVDLKHPRGREVFYDLVRHADAVCDNYRLGVLERLGIDYASLRQINPRIISCSVTGYGPLGPLASDPGFDPLMQARSGLMEWQGGDDEPVFHAIPVNDSASAIMAAFGIAAAVFARERTGEGQRVETSLTNSSVLCQSAELTRYEGVPAMPRGGRDHPGNFALQRLYQCAEGWVALAVRTGEQFQAMCVALGHPEWAGRMVAERALEEHAEGPLATLIAEALATMAKDDVVRSLLAMDVPVAPALATLEMFDSAWHLENGFFRNVDHPQFGPMTTVRSYGEFSRTPGGFPRRAPLLAEHARQILHEIGYEDATIDGLEQDGAIGRFRPPGE
jgi:crotonobetainyl-CoA:carnitine CoA-transferase CaiB-like acyl-CoA transferase